MKKIRIGHVNGHLSDISRILKKSEVTKPRLDMFLIISHYIALSANQIKVHENLTNQRAGSRQPTNRVALMNFWHFI